MSRQKQPQRTASGRQPRLEHVDFARDFEKAFAELRIAVERAYAEVSDDWPMQVAAAIRAVLEFASDEPVAARVLTVESLAQGNDHFARRRRPVDHLARLLAAGRDAHPEGEALPNLLEDALAGGVFMLIVQRLEVGDARTLRELAPDAIEFALTPYIGREKARDVAMARGPAIRPRSGRSPERDSNS